MNTFYLTTPIYYVNAKPHLGHAYTTIVGDVLARYHTMLGEESLLLTGTDEHGDKIIRTAEKEGISAREFVDRISANFRSLWPALGIDHIRFERTTSETHKKAVQDFLQLLYDKGDIYFGEFGGYYCYGCERFYTEKELENGLCPQHQVKPEFISEKNYFFRMSRYLPWLKEYLEAHPDMIRPERYRSETLAMLEGGVLEDLCISRPKSRLAWGIDLPFDPNYVCYVWFDALTTYIGGIGWPGGKEFDRYWPGEHLIAKDILKPHAIFWPCMLKAADLPIYKHLNVHGYWLSRDTKMSKSLGNVVDPLAILQDYSLDSFRYFLIRDMRFGSDASFSDEALVSRINADLANDLGNLFSRVLSMNGKYFGGHVPPHAPMNEDDSNMAALTLNAVENYVRLFGQMKMTQAVEALWEAVGALNKYVDSQAPWNLFKHDNHQRLCAVINLLLACMHKIAICLWPIMPHAAGKMLEQLGQKANPAEPPTRNLQKESMNLELLPEGRSIAVSSALFPRLEMPRKQPQTEKKEESHPIPPVDIAQFNALDLAIGSILKAERHPDADHLLCLDIDFGEESPRRIISGLADFYSPDELPGKQVCAILNLKPRKIRGLVSHGMVLTVQNGDTLTLLSCASPMPNGSRIS